MNPWPTELYSYVFQLACTDDGRTVRALSLASKQFREIARPYLYQSLALSTPQQVATLIDKLVDVPTYLRQIKHLFLVPRHDSSSSSHSSCTSDLTLTIRILQLASPTLHSLTLTAPCPLTGTSLLSYLFRIPFPNLDELSLAGLYAFSFPQNNFPRLRRLHFAAGNRNPHGLFQFGALDEAFPQLTHLRVSGLSRAVAFTEELGHALQSASKSTTVGDDDYVEFVHKSRRSRIASSSSLNDPSIKLPFKLERIYVQTSFAPTPSSSLSRSSSRSSSSSGTNPAKDAHSPPPPPIPAPITPSSNSTNDRNQLMMDRLGHLENEYGFHSSSSYSSFKNVPVRLIVLDPVPAWNNAGNRTESRGFSGSGNGGCDAVAGVTDRLKQDWLDRMHGRDGPWALPTQSLYPSHV
ncbi:hypothetical protein AX17_003712 [Amanita inopinata Kibby_2008]|nr:hypothetical protein AX17_003712 [Amanita inopinata Kibby_2008]